MELYFVVGAKAGHAVSEGVGRDIECVGDFGQGRWRPVNELEDFIGVTVGNHVLNRASDARQVMGVGEPVVGRALAVEVDRAVGEVSSSARRQGDEAGVR